MNLFQLLCACSTILVTFRPSKLLQKPTPPCPPAWPRPPPGGCRRAEDASSTRPPERLFNTSAVYQSTLRTLPGLEGYSRWWPSPRSAAPVGARCRGLSARGRPVQRLDSVAISAREGGREDGAGTRSLCGELVFPHLQCRLPHRLLHPLLCGIRQHPCECAGRVAGCSPVWWRQRRGAARVPSPPAKLPPASPPPAFVAGHHPAVPHQQEVVLPLR